MSAPARSKLEGKIAVITGATSGVGRSIALALAERGAELALVGRRPQALRAVAKHCRGLRARTHSFELDLTKENEVWDFVQQLLGTLPGIDILVNCAGVILMGSFAKGSLDDFDTQYRSNVRAPFALTQAFLPSLASRKGQVVFINSTAGLQASAGISQYSATKHALKALADSLREEVNSQGIRVVSLFLGRTATPMQRYVHEVEGRPYLPERLIQPDQVARTVARILELDPEAEITDLWMRPMHKP